MSTKDKTLMLMHNSKLGNVDDLVKSISLHVNLSMYLNGCIAPWILFYLTWLYFAVFVYDIFNADSDTFFLSMLAVILIAVLHMFVNLCCFWSVHVSTFLNARKIQHPEDAAFVKVCPTKNNGSPELVTLCKTKIKNNKIIANELAGITYDKHDETTTIYWFVFQKTKYIYNPEKRQFSALEFPIHMHYKYYGDSKGYKNEEEVHLTKSLYGDNSMVMVVPEFMELFKERATAPFFVFQIFAVLLWCLDDYWYYSLFTLFMLIVFECTLVQQQLRNMAEIRKMGNKPYQINVFRYNRWRTILSNELVPGDVISIGRSQNNQLVPCDILLVRGSCIVDESMLTGESVPQLKESIEMVDDRESTQLDVDGDSKLHCLFGGTKVVQHTAPDKNGIRGPDDGCIAYVLRNGFNTSQGKLLRTILFGVKRVTENNLETFAFIIFLLIFAVAAAAYVWVKGSLDPERNRYKLALECTLILTSIIPPDLPIELTLAVNTSLLKLTKLYVYCTEPFRIPMAGKLQICCFDKTGTLTSDDLMVEGVAGLTDDHLHITPIDEIPENTIQVLASCHTLVQLDDTLVGDPLEKATLNAIEWKLTKQDGVIPKRGKYKPLKIYHRFYFSSTLKRMSVIAGYLTPFTNEVHYLATVKGAPEILMGMLKNVPSYYEKTYIEFSRRGARVLALAIKDLGTCDTQTIRELKRENIECDLIFAGFVIISCPLKPDSKAAIKEIMRASHKVVMITGDNPLTACYVSSELRITRKPIVVLSQRVDSSKMAIRYDKDDDDDGDDKDANETNNDKNITSKWLWKSIANDVNVEIIENYKDLIKQYDLAITGDGLTYLYEHKLNYFLNIIPYISVYARVAPKQKEFVITTLKSLGYFTLMCGDGTNDVGALKHAHVGVSILSKQPRIKKRQLPQILDSTGLLKRALPSDAYRSVQPKHRQSSDRSNVSASGGGGGGDRNRNSSTVAVTGEAAVGGAAAATNKTALSPAQQRLQQAMKEMEEEQMQIVKLGDASIAAPFTSKSASITSVCHIIKQGRCTLVTTLQMFKILALNAIISAYCQSVLYIDGVKFSDSQATLQGIFIAACFLFITRSKPLTVLSKEAPLHNVFNIYTCSSILLQLCVHFTGLVYLTQGAESLSPPREGKVKLNVDLTPDETEEFVPNIVNSTIYIMCMALQISTFIVNHKGHPFMENLMENKYLLCAITTASVVVASLSIGFPVDLLDTFQIIEFPVDFKKTLIFVLVADLVLAYAVDRICSFLFVSSRKKNELL